MGSSPSACCSLPHAPAVPLPGPVTEPDPSRSSQAELRAQCPWEDGTSGEAEVEPQITILSTLPPKSSLSSLLHTFIPQDPLHQAVLTWMFSS